MKFSVRGRDAVSGAALNIVLDAMSLDDARTLATRKQIVDAVVDWVPGSEPVQGCAPPPVGYARKQTQAEPSVDRPVAVAEVVATARSRRPSLGERWRRRPAWLTRRRCIEYAVAIAVIGSIGIVGVVANLYAMREVDRARAAAERAGTFSPHMTWQHEMIVRGASTAAPRKQLRFLAGRLADVVPIPSRRTDSVMSPIDGLETLSATWIDARGRRCHVIAVGDPNGPETVSFAIATRSQDRVSTVLDDLASFALLASGELSADGWRKTFETFMLSDDTSGECSWVGGRSRAQLRLEPIGGGTMVALTIRAQ